MAESREGMRAAANESNKLTLGPEFAITAEARPDSVHLFSSAVANSANRPRFERQISSPRRRFWFCWTSFE